uniref:Uncharacterized protein n=1 Tax=Arundo donax TaxID=35708 RepID=A0A0A9D9Z6_ARUDO
MVHDPSSRARSRQK